MDDQMLRAEWELGLEVEAFLGTKVGEYLIGCCKQDRDLALEQLAVVDPEDQRAIRAIQQQVQICQMIPAYLHEIVIRSQQAEEALRQ